MPTSLKIEDLQKRLPWMIRKENGETLTSIANDPQIEGIDKVHRTTVMRTLDQIRQQRDFLERGRFSNHSFYAAKRHLEEWEQAQEEINHENRWLTGIIEGDVHFLDHDITSMALTRRIRQTIRPDFSVFNGDTLDFGAISNFAATRNEPGGDAILTVDPYYSHFVEEHLDEGSQWNFHNSGNHNVRLEYLLASMRSMESTIENSYRDLLRQSGAVVMHDMLEEVVVGPMIIHHGRRTNIHAAKSTGEDYAYGVSIVGSHKHVPSTWSIRQVRGYRKPDRVVKSAITPCLCRLIPKYAEHKTKKLSRWIQGVTIVNVHPQLDSAHIQQVEYLPMEDGLVAAIGSDVFFQPHIPDETGLEWW